MDTGRVKHPKIIEVTYQRMIENLGKERNRSVIIKTFHGFNLFVSKMKYSEPER